VTAAEGSAEGSLPALLIALQRRARFGMVLGLGPIRTALAELGDPQSALACVHVAGSNGKGSVCAMVESIARAAGLRTGLFTSPHLTRFAERIRINGEPIGEEAFASALERALRARGERGPQAGEGADELTFFEALAAAALLAFRDAGVDVAVLEVGLGGRLDATNVIEAPLATAVTSIALEHTDVLGGTLAAIAREKAGILKRGAPVALGPLDEEAAQVIEDTARAVGAGPVWRVARAEGRGWATWAANPLGVPAIEVVRVSKQADSRVLIEAPSSRGERVVTKLGLAGAHQAENAGVAAAIAWQLAARWPAITAAIADGLASARWPGRFEVIERAGVRVILDCAHNPHGALALARALREEGVDPARTALVFGALADKAWEPMLRALAPLASVRYYTSPKGRAPAPIERLMEVAGGARVDEPREALDAALAGARPGDTVLVTGSLYLVGEARGALLGIEADPIIAL
jgi:dihydrofolate synthase / folylpolyglutamate synthase